MSKCASSNSCRLGRGSLREHVRRVTLFYLPPQRLFVSCKN